MAGIASSADLRDLAEQRLSEAQVLCDQGLYSGAFYLAGYSVELGLKAVLTRELQSHSMPDKGDIVKAHTHKLNDLALTAGLDPASGPREARIAWNVVATNWGPESRYQEHEEQVAREMVQAVEEVLAWLKSSW